MPFKSYLSNRIRIHNTPSYQHRYRRHGASQKNQSALAFASKISLLTVLQGCRRFNILIDKTSSSSDSWLIFIHPIYWTYCMHRNTASPCQSRISSASSDYRGLRWLSATRHLWASSHSSRILSSTWGQTGKATFAWKKNKSQLTMATALVNWRKGILRSEKKARERAPTTIELQETIGNFHASSLQGSPHLFAAPKRRWSKRSSQREWNKVEERNMPHRYTIVSSIYVQVDDCDGECNTETDLALKAIYQFSPIYE